jgi:GntR family transcriptional regulator, rspAB operon transcriptional repressor
MGEVLRVSSSLARVGEPDEAPLDIPVRLDRRQTVSDQVYDALRDAIANVRLLPGTSISENRICRHFGVSRTPVRTAIVRLAEEGLIDVYPQQGSFVAPIRLSGIEDSRFIRRVLEVAVLSELAPRWTPAMSEEQRSIIAAQAQAVASGDNDAFFREDQRFHRAFCVHAGREGVWGSIQLAMMRLARFHRLFGLPTRLHVVLEEHTAVVDALDRHDAAAAVRLLEAHIEMVFNLLDRLPEQYRRCVEN